MTDAITIESLNVSSITKKQISQLELAIKPNHNDDFFCYLFPDNDVDLSTISLEAKPFGIYLQRFTNNSGYISISCHK